MVTLDNRQLCPRWKECVSGVDLGTGYGSATEGKSAQCSQAERLGVRTYDAIYEEQRAQCPQALIVRKDLDREWTIVAGADKRADGPLHLMLPWDLFCFVLDACMETLGSISRSRWV